MTTGAQDVTALELSAFENGLRAWLAERLMPASDGVADSSVALVEEIGADVEAAVVDAARQWQSSLHAAGYADLRGEHRQVFRRVAADFQVPDLRPLMVGLHIVAPALLRHGSERLKRAYLDRILRGELIACQLFSEPDAGSDLAAVRTSARRTAGGWLVNGQKIWTSYAHISDIAEVLVRTDPAAPKHRGLSLFMLDMDQRGIDVRPLRQMTGGASFNEVFLTDVFVPEDNVIGGLGEGWTVAMTSLAGERAALGGQFDALPPRMLDRLVAMAQARGCAQEPLVLVALAEVGMSLFATKSLGLCAAAGELPAEVAGPATKLMVNRTVEHAAAAAAEIGGTDVVSVRGTAPDSDWSEFILGKPALRIAGGTDEIQRTLIAERHLGLPREAR